VKVLWCKSGGLVPLDTGGKIRSFNLLKELGRRHEVTLFTFYGVHENDVHSDLKQYFSRVVNIPISLPSQRGLAEAIQYAGNLITRQPYSLVKYASRQAARILLQLLNEGHYDVLICDFLFSAPIVPWGFPIPTILFTHNVETQIWKRHYEVTKNPIWKAVTWREYRTMARSEELYLKKANHVLTVSETDKTLFSSFLPMEKMTVIPTGVDTEYFFPAESAPQGNRLVFTGSMDWMPNEDAIFYFVEKIFSQVRREVPDASLWVVGRTPSARLEALATSNSGVHVTGTVEDIRPFVRDASVYVVPLRVGGGTRIKIFEAMAMGKAIVSTPIGAEGLPVTHEEDILLEENAEGFASQVVRLLRDATLRKNLGHNARSLVEQNYSWASVSRSFDTVFNKLVKSGKETDEVFPVAEFEASGSANRK
jgi:sugar transferase (PEP-CTERM/EpsH1 system associated)